MKILKILLFLIFLPVFILFFQKADPLLLAHSGGLDSQGCHGGSKPYHCHRSPSEMIGNRLRCDLGSKSSECLGVPSEPKNYINPPNFNIPSQTKKSFKNSQGKGITIFGVGFGLRFEELQKILKKRFNCDLFFSSGNGICDSNINGFNLAYIEFDTSLRPIRMHFNCATYNGCGLNEDEVFSQLNSKYNFVSMDYFGNCGNVSSGEKICVGNDRISVLRDKFGASDLTFD